MKGLFRITWSSDIIIDIKETFIFYSDISISIQNTISILFSDKRSGGKWS